MRIIYSVVISYLILANVSVYGQLGVDNTDPHPSSVLDMNSNDKGLLIPRMTSTQREAIVSPANSLLVFDTTVNTYFYYRDGQWQSFDRWSVTPSNSDIYYSSGNVGIGMVSPNAPLQFDNSSDNRKVALWEFSNNDYQYSGFGTSGGSLHYNAGNDHIWFVPESATGNIERMRLSQDGKLGIGVVSQGRLNVKGTDWNSHFSYGSTEDTYIRGGKTTSRVIINDVNSGNIAIAEGGGNVGIGAGTPTDKLHIIKSVGSAYAGGVIEGGVRIDSHLAGTSGNYAQNGITFYGDADNASFIYQVHDNAGSSELVLGSNNNERVRIDVSGNVGVGIDPSATLDVIRGAGMQGTAAFRGTTNTSHFNYSTNEDTYIRGGKASSQLFLNDASSGAVRIAEGGGNVGVGGFPTYQFDVQRAGHAQFRLLSTAAGQMEIIFARTNATPTSWSQYVPSGSTDMRLYNAGDKFTFSTSGTGTATDWIATSDRRLKQNIIAADSQLNRVVSISQLVKNYDRTDTKKNETGFVAQELLKVAPEYVNVPDDSAQMMSVNYSKMVVPLYKAVAELRAQVEALRQENMELKALLNK